MTMTQAKPLPDRDYRNVADILDHVREQAALLVFRMNPGREWATGEFAAKIEQVYWAMLRRLVEKLEALGRFDLSAKIILAPSNEGLARELTQARMEVTA